MTETVLADGEAPAWAYLAATAIAAFVLGGLSAALLSGWPLDVFFAGIGACCFCGGLTFAALGEP